MRLVLHTISYAGLWGQVRLTLTETIAKAAALGFDGVEIVAKRPHLSVIDATDSYVGEVREALRQHGLACACLAAYTNWTGGAEAGEVPFGEMQVLYIERLAELAAALDCTRIRIFTSYRRRDMSFADQWARTVGWVREAAERAARWGVTLGIQNHHDLAVTAEELAQFIDDVGVGNVKAFFDAWAPAVQGRDAAQDARFLGSRIDFTTVADYRRFPHYRYRPELVNYVEETPAMQAVPMGEGVIDYPAFFEALRDVGYDGFVSYEMCSPIRGGGSEENLDAYCRKFLEYMKPWVS